MFQSNKLSLFKNKLKINKLMIKNIVHLEIIVIMHVNTEVLKNSIPKEASVAFHNGSNYNSDFVIRELGKEFEGKLII